MEVKPNPEALHDPINFVMIDPASYDHHSLPPINPPTSLQGPVAAPSYPGTSGLQEVVVSIN